MQNIPRIFIDNKISTGDRVPAGKEIVHYLRHVMRRGDCLVFNDGVEYTAFLTDDNKNMVVGEKTNRVDPSNKLTFCFAPIKKTDEMLNMATQMGVGVFQPVITDRTVANHINWNRMRKIIIEAAEQSGRNSVPEILEPVKLKDLDFSNLVVADERAGHGKDTNNIVPENITKVLVGPEGGFSENEFRFMEEKNVCGISLGKTILRAEVAAVVAVAKVLNK